MNKQINPTALTKLLNEAAIALINFNPNATYSASSTGTDMRDVVLMAIDHYGMTRENSLQALLEYRQAYEKQISKRYGVKFTYTQGEDLEKKYARKRVPQKTQVVSGLLDLLIGRLNINVYRIYGK